MIRGKKMTLVPGGNIEVTLKCCVFLGLSVGKFERFSALNHP